jgi:hypothetical protein
VQRCHARQPPRYSHLMGRVRVLSAILLRPCDSAAGRQAAVAMRALVPAPGKGRRRSSFRVVRHSVPRPSLGGGTGRALLGGSKHPWANTWRVRAGLPVRDIDHRSAWPRQRATSPNLITFRIQGTLGDRGADPAHARSTRVLTQRHWARSRCCGEPRLRTTERAARELRRPASGDRAIANRQLLPDPADVPSARRTASGIAHGRAIAAGRLDISPRRPRLCAGPASSVSDRSSSAARRHEPVHPSGRSRRALLVGGQHVHLAGRILAKAEQVVAEAPGRARRNP